MKQFSQDLNRAEDGSRENGEEANERHQEDILFIQYNLPLIDNGTQEKRMKNQKHSFQLKNRGRVAPLIEMRIKN